MLICAGMLSGSAHSDLKCTFIPKCFGLKTYVSEIDECTLTGIQFKPQKNVRGHKSPNAVIIIAERL